jgi:hypothetical protein
MPYTHEERANRADTAALKDEEATSKNNALRGQSYDAQVQMLAPVQMQEATTKPGFHSAYGEARAHLGQSYEEYKASLGTLKATSEYGGKHAAQSPITLEELFEIFPGLAADAKDPEVMKKAETYLERLNFAFGTMKLDTVDAQASYLANAFSESDQFRKMTETQGQSGDPEQDQAQKYIDKPGDVKLNTKWLDKAAAGQVAGVGGYEKGGAINPEGDWTHSFIGRGPVQVTFRFYYVQALATMEQRADELRKEDPESPEAAQLQEAVDAIKKDPANASDTRYTFLFSAAFMKMKDSKGNPRDQGLTQAVSVKGKVEGGAGPQTAASMAKKTAPFLNARKVLGDKAKKEAAEKAKAQAEPAPEQAASPGDVYPD